MSPEVREVPEDLLVQYHHHHRQPLLDQCHRVNPEVPVDLQLCCQHPEVLLVRLQCYSHLLDPVDPEVLLPYYQLLLDL